jgi:uncharacterized protein YueI
MFNNLENSKYKTKEGLLFNISVSFQKNIYIQNTLIYKHRYMSVVNYHDHSVFIIIVVSF